MKTCFKIASVILLFVFLALFWRFEILPWTSFVPMFAHDAPTETESILLEDQGNKRQTDFYCGAYDVHYLLTGLGIENRLSEVLDYSAQKMIPRMGVVVEVLSSTLKKYGVNSRTRTFRWMDDASKADTLKYLLQDKPIMPLIKRHGYFHYVLLVGYSGDTVYVYDSMLGHGPIGLTEDRNGDLPGNDSISFDALVEMWNEVSFFGFSENMAIIINPALD